MPAQFNPTPCVNRHRPVLIRFEIPFEKPRDWHLVKTRPVVSKKVSCPIVNEQDQNVKTNFHSISRQKSHGSGINGVCSHCNTVIEALGCFYLFCLGQEVRTLLSENDIKRSNKRRELYALRRSCIQKKQLTVIEMWKREWWRMYNASNNVKKHIQENFSYRCPLAAEQLLEEIRNGNFFDYVHTTLKYLINWEQSLLTSRQSSGTI